MSAEPVAMEAEERVQLTEGQRRKRRARSIAIGVVLAVLAVLFYVMTMVKLGPGVFDRSL